MKKIIKKVIASICAMSLVVGSLSALGTVTDVEASTGATPTAIQLAGYKNITTSSFYQGNEQMPDSVRVDGGAGATDTVAVYSTVKDMQGNVIANHHKTLLSMKVHFENDVSQWCTRLEVAGTSDNTGFRLYPEKDMNKLRVEGIGGIQSDTSVFRIASDKLTSFAEEFILQMSFEYGDFDGDLDSNDVKVGVYINGSLGTTNHEVGNAAVVNHHAVFYDCDLTKLGTYMKLYTEKDASACDLSVSSVVPKNINLTEVTWSDFVLAGTDVTAEDKVFTPDNTPSDHSASTYVLNKTGIEKFENTSVELEVKFNTDGGADKMYFGGSSTWYGVMLYPTGSGNLALVNNTSLSPDFGLTEEALYFEPTVAKLTDKTFLNHEFVMKITTEYGDYDGDGASDDVQLGFYFDGNLYNNQYCYVNNYKSSDLTGNYIAINAGNGVTVKSVVDATSVVTANVAGVYKESASGQVKLALETEGSTALPTSASYSNISVNVSDGTTATDYRVNGTLTDGILSLDLTDKIVADATNVITVQAGTYAGMNVNAKVYLKLEEDFVCYQDKTSGVVYEKLGSTKLEEGQNFNGGTPAEGDLYLVGTDLTGKLQGFVSGQPNAGGEWWTIFLVPLNEESGVFRQSADGDSVRLTTDECEVKYPTEGNMQYYVNVKGNNADGDIFTIKGQFQVVNTGDSYKNYLDVIEIEESKYQYTNGQWSSYVEPTGPWTAEAEVAGVYKESSAGTVKVALSALGDTTLPVAGTCTDIQVTISDGSTEQNYNAVEGTIGNGILTLNLADKIIADATNEITIKAGTYHGTTVDSELVLAITSDFVCYQDKSSGVVYQKLGSTTLEIGQNFNGGAPQDGDLYLVGTDLTGELQGFTEGYTSAGGEWWTIYLTPLNEESGVFRQSEGGESVRMTTEDYYVKYPTEGNIQYYIFVGDHKADGDVFTIKGQFQVVKDGNYYKDYQNVIDFEEVQYEYNQGLWRKYTPPVELEQPDESFKKITFSHFNIKDNTYVNSGKDEFQAEGSAKLSLNKTLLCGKIRLEDGHNYDIRYGGKDSIWYGLFIDVTQYGSWHAYWIDSNGALQGPLVSMDSDIAGTALFGSTLDFMLSTEIIDADGDGKENDIQFGFWFEDVLYNNEYIVVKDKADELGSKLGIMAKGEGTTVTINSIADLVEPVDPETIVTLNENFKKITFSHFGIEDDTYKYTGSGFSAMGKYRDSLDKTVFSGDVFIPEGSKFTLRYGGNEHAWYGLTFNIEERGVLHLAWIDDDGVKYLVTDISSSKAQTQLFNKWLNIKVSSEIIDADKDGKKDDIRFGIWFNDIPYKEEYVIVYDKAANLGSYFGVVCDTEGTYLKIRSIAELVEPFNYEAYGLTKDWEKTLLNTGLTSDIPIGGSRESGPYSGDFSNIGKVLAMVTLGAAGIVFCIFERKRKKGSLSNI